MGMLFFEVFDQLMDLPKELEAMFREVLVEKVSVSRTRAEVKIYIQSNRLIQRPIVKKMEYQLKRQLFSLDSNCIILKENYVLSAQYTPEKLFDIYKDSILEEFRERSILEYNVFSLAEIRFEEYIMIFSCEENFLVRKVSVNIVRHLSEIFKERFNFAVTVRFEYYEPKKVAEEEEYEFIKSPSGNIEYASEPSVPLGEEMVAEASYRELEQGKELSAALTTVAKEVQDAGKSAKQKPAYDKSKYSYKKTIHDPDTIYGKGFEGETLPISEVQDEIGEVVIRGKIINVDSRELRNEKTIIIFTITDFTDSIQGKIFIKTEDAGELLGVLKKGRFIKLKGMALMDKYDREITIGSIVGIKTIPDFTTTRQDNSTEKRVELHAHTMMSDMDAVIDVKDLVKRAFMWGHKAVAITDHGVVQAFPEANHALSKKDVPESEWDRLKEFKVIYGVEAYLVDDLKEVVVNEKGQTLTDTFVVFDIETTGFGPVKDRIIEIGAVKVAGGKIIDKYSTFINPEIPIPYEIETLTGIKDDMVLDSPTIDVILPQFLAFCEGSVLVAHNASFDVSFITKKAEYLGLDTDFTVIDTVGLARILLPDLSRYKLNIVAKALGISLENHHRAVDDAGATAEIFVRFVEMLKEQEVSQIGQINAMSRLSADAVKKLPTYHAIILAQNNIGRENLYKLISLSHIEYYSKRPRIPKSVFLENREGLLIGSACEAGELYQAILREQPPEEINRLVDFYDYLEIQPLGNNDFMIRSDKININSKEELMDINRRIVKLGEEFNKPVVATCDVHFMDPEDEIYRRIIMAGKGFKDADEQAPLYYRTTEEMLEEFMYLGREKAHEVVIANTNKIADMIEKISPVRPDKCPPVIEDSDKTLREICYNKAHSVYGPNLPKQVEQRLEHELQSIISNGFAVMYIIAQKLVWKSNEDGYLVGSRGSVGSSFVATMSGITEVNPLAAHYYCTHCFYSDFDSEEVKAYSGSSGCDMPDKLCPGCGQPLSKDGHDIPFETFLGFNGDKEPDIDLNFSGEYQSKAHEYTEVIFGEGHTFRAGTIGTLADKTAYGYVLKYYEERDQHRRRAEIERIVAGCVGVRRTTGQHPGGIIVLPHGEEIYSFTPVQRPANDMSTKIITTHFDYHSIDHNLLKLDILGHDDPTMIRMLEDLTGVDAKTIRLDEEKVLSLFDNLSALKIKPEDIGGCDLGCLGVPEFGTDFVMQMLRDTKPKTFSDLVRISGLSHGTDVWLNNAQTLITEGKCTLATAICTRDDIMTYLIYQGVDSGLSFKIMESVRKGKGLTPDMEEAMLKEGIPDWYIWSCKRIKYMFPKAHAAAYVMMAFRIAYFKVYYPLAYYAAYFSIRASAFNYELMCLGRERLERYLADYKRRMNELSKKEQDVYKDMRIVQEMYARGFDFVPIDIYTAKAHHFQIIGDKLMPSLSTIDGLGDKAADAVVEAVKDGKFLSRDDFKSRCKVSSTVVDLMADLDLLGDMPISNQISLMDFLQ
ncbi:DNA polymerase III PolC-type [Anaerocolumna cellulosilytica]|uniref:DNA polymerase III PolC-type n=1 Tax=Anaerocolumna cellulosilytica TaxID=433286 RepID=A0A6S6R061_9FIRM|nr:PolC-type DNA polymerase III [Anaerocolumna cellulosilytica]MBB5197410.1 DNA polymerase-3 subunit alpha (Gram-positive type) [Anaerocolumna cellulosilytica]BCJ95426.1 DNA polymerase III PolC-type [Anaerocolumna cellulosilytica]